MLAKLTSFSLIGLEGYPIAVEADVTNGLPGFEMVGLAEAAVKESKDRVRAAIKNSGRLFPPKKITVNLAPADLKKEGSHLDLAIAVCLLKAYGGQLVGGEEDTVFLGELSLDGSLRFVTGILPILISAVKKGYKKFIIPKVNEKEASYIEGAEIIACNTLTEVVEHINGLKVIEPTAHSDYYSRKKGVKYDADLKYVKGQAMARRALEVAVSGGHNMLMIGPPGAGKTMLAKCIPTIMPDMDFEEALEVTQIHSVCGYLDREDGIVYRRPFRTPHHTATTVAMTGGGAAVKPGEISLAHNGVLFLDEIPEYKRSSLESLRQPLEDRCITIARAASTVTYPANFMLVASMNPCPCGNFGSKDKECTCSPSQIAKYRSRLSGPLMDRIDLQVEVDGVKYQELASDKESESSEQVKARVNIARKIQKERFKEDGITTNAEMGEKQLNKYCKLSADCEFIMQRSFDALKLSARARSRIIKVARTIADLAYIEEIQPNHLLEAIGYRSVEKY